MSDLYQSVTDAIIAQIEAGAGAYQTPWTKSFVIPKNAVTGQNYRGINILTLWCAQEARAFSRGIWATFQQWQSIGACVRKGETATRAMVWKTREQSEDEGEGEDKKSAAFAKTFCLFNAAQVEGFAVPEIPAQLSDDQRITNADLFFANCGADVKHGGDHAFYVPSSDFIQLPDFASFHDPLAYYSTSAHEHIHWTGAKSRLNRQLSTRFGDDAYCAEELVAELGAAFLCARLGLSQEPRPDHAPYIARFLKLLKADNRAIFIAAAMAQKAADYLSAFQDQEQRQAA